MTAENFDNTLNTLRNRSPFQAFLVELATGERYEIDHRDALVNHYEGHGRAIFFGPGNILRFFDHNSVTQFIDAPRHMISEPKTEH